MHHQGLITSGAEEEKEDKEERSGAHQLMLERPVLLRGCGHRDGEMLDWNCGRRSSAVMDIDINIRQELVMLLSGSGYGGQQQQQQQQVIKKSKACMNVELFPQRSSSTTTTTTTAATSLLQQQQQQQQKEQQRPRQQLKPPEEVVACPRCQSLNTKFCYYNNYSLTQPRHFCKNCRRYWTAGGTLRNVPVGGGCRKIKRSSCKSSTTTYHHLQHQHQQHTAAALAANSAHAAIIYDSPPPLPAGHGFISHHGILDTFNCDNTHAAAAAAAVQWLQQQQHTPMSSFATILHDQNKDLELMQVPAAAAGLSSCIDDHRLVHDSQQQQQPLQESCSIMNRLGGLFHSVQQQQHPDAAAVNSSCRHINASRQHDAAALCSSTVGLDDFQSSVNFVDNSSSRCTSRAEAGVCNYNIQLPSERRLVAAAHDQQGNTTTTTFMPSHNDNTNSTAAESWRVVLQIPKQEEQEQEEDTTTTLQSWPPVHEEHTTLQQAGSLDLNSFKQDHHVKAMEFFHVPSSLSLPSCTHRLGEEEEEEESEEAKCVEQHERPGAAAPGATPAPAAAIASWHHYLYSASQHHVAPGMPQCYEAVTAPPPAAAAAADTLSSFWSNPSWSHLDLQTLCGSGSGATLL